MHNRKKKYTPQSRFNPIIQAKKIEKFSQSLEDMKNVLQTVIDTYEKHMEYLSNFASHNMGNAIQSMYAALVKYDSTPLANELKTSVNNLNSILESFKQVVSCTHDKEFTIKEIMIAIETLTRTICHLNQIDIVYEYDRTSTTKIKLPFQSILQVLHNLISNSIKALNTIQYQKRILISASLDEDSCIFTIKDNGIGIPEENIDKIFEYKFTTTKCGSGIGLFYTKYIIQEKLNGSITIEKNKNEFTTIFNIRIPYGKN